MLLVYARWNADDYAAWIEKAQHVTVTTSQSTNIAPPSDARTTIPGALRLDVYEFLDRAQQSPNVKLTAAQMSALAETIPEIDGSRFQQEMPAAARSLTQELDDLDDEEV
jgi:hypothetical protein